MSSRRTHQRSALRERHADDVRKELEARAAAHAAERAAERASAEAACADAAARLVRLAERVVAYREATGGMAVPLKDWREWVALFVGGGGCGAALAAPLVLDGAERAPGAATGGAAFEEGSAAAALNQAEVEDYLGQAGDWAPPADALPTDAADAAGQAGAATSVPAGAAGQQAAEQLGRAVLGLAAAAAAAKAGGDAAGGAARARPALDHPLRLAVAGAPYSGKTTVAQALARHFGLKLLAPEALVEEAVAAARAWGERAAAGPGDAPPPGGAPAGAGGAPGGQLPAIPEGQAPEAAAAAATAGPEAPAKVLLGRRLAEVLAAGEAVPDNLLAGVVALGIEEARSYVAPPPEPPSSADGGGGKRGAGGSAGAAGAAAKAPKAGGGQQAAAAAAQQAGMPPALPPPHSGGPGRGFVVDGFPATASQSAALERLLTGLDLVSEAALASGASLLAPPPRDALPLLGRPLASGLDAVILLECGDEAAAAGRALGRRVDPVTGGRPSAGAGRAFALSIYAGERWAGRPWRV